MTADYSASVAMRECQYVSIRSGEWLVRQSGYLQPPDWLSPTQAPLPRLPLWFSLPFEVRGWILGNKSTNTEKSHIPEHLSE